MKESKLRELSMEFSVEIIELVKYLKSIKGYDTFTNEEKAVIRCVKYWVLGAE